MCLPSLDSYKHKVTCFPKAFLAVASKKGSTIGKIRDVYMDNFSGHTVFEYLALWESLKFQILRGRKKKLLPYFTVW